MHLSTHILDTARGCAAKGIAIIFEETNASGGWTERSRGITDADGRIKDLFIGELKTGTYLLRFATADYFRQTGDPIFYPEVSIVVILDSTAERYHLPLLLSPFGYSTYRGS